ncbi:MAG: NAD(+)/NADH kinase [Planctomycetes bacterium]|nr:NAD(+)/NADH kinase [Planctomycetota bacterium]
MDLQRAVLIPKATKIEHDLKRLALTPAQLPAYYGADHADAIYASHERQLEMRRRVRALLPEVREIPREEISAQALAGASLVIALGGDNHFIYVTHFLDGVPVLGVNADRLRSHGGLLSVNEENLEETVRRLRGEDPAPESWTRIEATVDGRFAGRATSEFFVGETFRKHMSRHVLRKNDGREEEQKCSGVLVASGAGSTGWYGAYGESFGRTQPVARWAATEAFPHGTPYGMGTGELRPGDTLTIRSRNDAQGVVSVDCLKDVPFDYGCVATFRVSDVPLRVVRATPM